MEKRFSQRKTGKLLAAAVGAAGLAGFGVSQADASLIIDVRAISSSGGTITNGGKSVTLTSPGDTITLGIFARVSGTNGINDEQIQSAGGSVSSVGAIKGNLSGSVVAPFNGSSSTNGAVQDFDSDGDLDLGSLGSTSTGKLFARSNAFTPAPGVDAQTGEVQIAQATFTYTGGGTVDTQLNYLVRSNSTGGPLTAAALWNEDGSTANSNPSGSVFAAGAPVNVSVPEPASLGLLGLASIGLLARRRK